MLQPRLCPGASSAYPCGAVREASVLAVVLDEEGGQTRSLEKDETAFVKFFAREVEDTMRTLVVHA